MLTADFSRGLPDLRAGVYRHWKGQLYQVMGYAHDANLGETVDDGAMRLGGPRMSHEEPRIVVVYMGLELTEAHKGPRMAVRTAEDFFALVCSICGGDWECQVCPPPTAQAVRSRPVARFEYLGPAWYGE